MANPRYIQAQSFTLSAAGASSGATSITLQSFLLSDGVTPITTTMLGDQCYATLEPNNGTQEEAFQFTGVTQNSNGTATLTGVSTLGFVYPYTATSGLAKSHAGGVTVVLTNDAALYGNIISYINGVVASGASTASDTVQGITKVSFNQGSNPRARSTLVSQQASPNMTLLVNSFSYQNGGTTITFVGKTLAYINGVNTSTFVAPVTNPRYDLIVYRPSLTDCTSITGVEGASPSLPTPLSGDIILASIYHTTTETKLLERSDGNNGYVSSWYEPTQYTNATNIISDNVTNGGYDQYQMNGNSVQAVGQANATTKASIVAQKFYPTVPHIRGVSLFKQPDTGTFTGSIQLSLQVDATGSPSPTVLASSVISNTNWGLVASGAFSTNFTSEYESMQDLNPYWIVVTPSTSDNSNHPNLGTNASGGYTNGILKYNNSSDGWVTVPTTELYFQSLEGVNSKVVSTDASGNIGTSITKQFVNQIIPMPVSSVTTNSSIGTSSGTTLKVGLVYIHGGIVVNKIKVSCTSNSSTGNVYVGIWSQDGQTLITSGSVSVSSSTVFTINLSSPITINNGYYWIGILGDSGGINNAYSTFTGGGVFDQAFTNGTASISLAGNYTVSPATIPPTLTLSSIVASGSSCPLVLLSN